jgi:predicted tellurium resistance membrane protein TerC
VDATFLASVQDPENWVALATLSALEIVLGVDNIVFIAIMTGRLPRDQRVLAYRLGLGAALISRLLLLSMISMIMRLNAVLFTLFSHGVTGRDLVLIVGGLFLLGKASHEIFESVEGQDEGERRADRPVAGLWTTVAQIMVIDIVFSVDSVITAVGLGQEMWVMTTAMVLAVLVMLIFARRIGEFVNRHPSVKILALSFLMLIGVLLVADGFGQHVDKGYVYFAMAFSFFVELLNLRMRGRGPAADETKPAGGGAD